jgi:hypothetical protein
MNHVGAQPDNFSGYEGSKFCRASLGRANEGVLPYAVHTGVAVFLSGLKNGIFTTFAVTC